MEKNLTTEARRHREKAKYTLQNGKRNASKKFLDIFNSQFSILIFASLCLCVSVVISSCGSKPADLRALIPADSLVYLESNDLGAVMNAITERPAFREAAKTIPDFSVLNGVKLAVAVTGFETKELPVTDENSVLSFTPHFVAVLETNAWNFQAISFTQDKLGEFINQVYGGEVLLETSDKHDGKYFVWAAKDGRKAFALVQGSIVFFGNDETSIDKCLAVKRGEADSISKNPKITNGDRLAFGYVSPDGIAQISNIIGVKYGSEASEQPEVQSAIAGILPQILRNSISGISWMASKTNDGVEDEFLISTPAEVANIFAETLASGEIGGSSLADLLPRDPASVTVYNFKDPQIAWRSVILLLQKQTAPAVGKMLAAFSDSMFENYGISDPELFLKSVGPPIVTMKQDDAGEKLLVVAPTNDSPIKQGGPAVGKALAPDVPHFTDVYQNANYDGNTFIYGMGNVYIGDVEIIRDCNNRAREDAAREPQIKQLLGDIKAAVVTVGTDRTTAFNIASAIDVRKSDSAPSLIHFRTETRFTRNGIERKTISEFGFIGWIVTQFGKDE